jgi:hypothetical protein
MPSTAKLSAILAFLFAILTWAISPQETWRYILATITAILIVVTLVLWIVAHVRENKPRLKANINCLTVEGTRDIGRDKWDCFLTMNIEVENAAADATILHFDCEVACSGSTVEGQSIYNLTRYEQFAGYEPSDDPSDPKPKEVWDPLADFPADALVIKSRPVHDWLRFHFESLPAVALRTDTDLADAALIKLYAVTGLNENRKRHLVYEGPEPEGSCGRIRKIEPDAT